jgi:putative toxin-antitoxin system antitoxin component (TIGR02293 family)
MAERGALTAKRIAITLGGDKVFHGRVRTLDDLRRKVEQGLAYASLQVLSSRFKIEPKTMRSILHLPERTLARRKGEKRLRPDESDRLVRVGRIATLAEVTLGSREKAAGWLQKSNRALGNDAPLNRLDTDLGARQVEDVLLRIAYGVYS